MMRRLLQNRTFRGFTHILSGNALQSLSQGAQFFVLARALGPDQFGQVAAAGAVTALLAPYSGMGAANVLVMRASRDPSVTPTYFGNALAVMLVTGSLLVALSMGGVALFLSDSVSVSVMCAIGASELLAAKLIDISWHVFVARQELHLVSVFLGAQSVTRLAAAALYVMLAAHPNATAWGITACVSNLAVSCWVLRRTFAVTGRIRIEPRLAWREMPVGTSFAIGLSAKGFYTDADKVFLARGADAAIVAFYTMAFRVVRVAMVPAQALSFALRAKMFRAGEGGIEGTLGLTLRLRIPMILLGLFIALCCFLSAPLLPWIAGAQYTESVGVLRFLAFLPIVLALQSMLFDTLACSGHERAAAVCQVVAGVVVCVLCIVLIPRLGWQGAAYASYVSQLVLSAMLFWMIRRARGKVQSLSGAPAA